MDRKAAAYLGFARRAGKLALGMNAVASLKKTCLLVADRAVSENSREKIEGLQKRFSCPLAWCEGLGEAAGKAGCMLAAVGEEHLAAALLGVLGTENESED